LVPLTTAVKKKSNFKKENALKLAEIFAGFDFITELKTIYITVNHTDYSGIIT
jgi:hypothetical protein